MFIPKAGPKPWTEANTGSGEAMKGQRPGFTLIELIIVFTLIGILVGLGLPQFKYATRKAREAVLKEDLFQMRKLIDQYYTDKEKYPAALQALVEEGYLRQIPVDPFTKSSQTWTEVRETLTEENLLSGQTLGITDVHSGATEKGMDGTAYNTW
jgi:general secretion pathway protein G